MKDKIRFKAVLSRTTTDMMKSKILSPHLCQIVLDCYMTPQEFADLITKYDEEDFSVIIQTNEGLGERSK